MKKINPFLVVEVPMKKQTDTFEVEVKVTYQEYKEIQKNFPYQIRKRFFIAFVIILSLFFLAYLDEPSELLENIVAVIFLSVCAYGILKIIEALFRKKNYQKLFQTNIDNIHYKLFFYDDYLEKKSEHIVQKIFYYQIWKLKENETHLYLLLDKEHILPIRKNMCSEEEMRQIRKILWNGHSNREHKEDFQDYINPREKYAKMRKFLIFLFVLTILSIWLGPIISLAIAYMNVSSYVIEYFPSLKISLSSFYVSVPNAPIIDYLWGAWLVLPIPLLSIILGIKYKKKGVKCKKNIVGGSIVMLILLLIGLTSYIYPVEQEYKNVSELQEILGVALPKEGRLFELELDQSDIPKLSYVLWNDTEEVESFYENIKENENWVLKSEINPSLNRLLMSKCMSKNKECYYSIYIKETNEYNKMPMVRWQYHIYSMMYDPEIHSLKMEEFISSLDPNH